MFRIGDFSKVCRIPVSALRYYADIGLLEPLHIDKFTGYRYYSLDQLPRLNRILALKDLGLSLTQVAQILNEDLPASEIRGMLRLKEAELQEELADREARLARVRAKLKYIEQEDNRMSTQEIVLKSIEAQWALSLREIVPTPESVGGLFMEIAPLLMANHIEVSGIPYTVFYDDEFKPAELDVEVVFPVTNASRITLDLERGRKAAPRQMPAVELAACIIHTGPYETLASTYSHIGKWIETSGYSIIGPIREIYLRPPGEGEETPITEIQFPVKKG